MRVDELAPLVYDLIALMLSVQTELALVPIVRRYENGPRPKPIYLAYNPNPNIREIGKVTQIEATGSDPVRNRQDYEVSVDVHEVGGDGQYLQLIKQLRNHLSIRSFMDRNLFSILRVSQAFSIPKLLDNDNWEKQSSMEMIIAFTHVTEDTTTYIETVEINNNI